MNTSHSSLPKLTVNGQFMQDFIAAGTSSCALGVIEEGNQKSGLLALHLPDSIPPAIAAQGFAFSHELLGTSRFEVVHFVFRFYGFQTYHVLINPNNQLVQAVLGVCQEVCVNRFWSLRESASEFCSKPIERRFPVAVRHGPRATAIVRMERLDHVVDGLVGRKNAMIAPHVA
jgi:hypothetical protein